MTKHFFEFLRSGINTTLQDNGRDNLYHIGIPFSGAMDRRNYLIANYLVGKKNNEPAIEFAYQGPLIKFFGEKVLFAITGDVNFNIIRNNSNVEEGKCYQTYKLSSGDQIDIQSTKRSVYGYLSINSNFVAEKSFGSYSINTKAKIGANDGKKFENKDKIFFYKSDNDIFKKINYINFKFEKLRVIKGTNFEYFDEKSKKIFFEQSFKVTKLSDRMGMRLEGKKLENKVNTNIKSEGLIKGVIQVPADGNPIIMLSDHGTIGGYPKIAVVVSADYDKLVQLQPGASVKFENVEISEAENLNKLYNLETNNLLNSI